MALFKIEKGLAANLATNRPKANEGYAYFTTDDGKFYIDIAGNGTQNAVVGTNRICLNAAKADQIAHDLIFRINGGTSEANGNQITFNGSAERTINFLNGNGITISANATNKGNITITNAGATGVKGGAENSYRTGNVNITGANVIGSTAIGNASTPIYWDGSSFIAITTALGATITIRRWTA